MPANDEPMDVGEIVMKEKFFDRVPNYQIFITKIRKKQKEPTSRLNRLNLLNETTLINTKLTVKLIH